MNRQFTESNPNVSKENLKKIFKIKKMEVKSQRGALTTFKSLAENRNMTVPSEDGLCGKPLYAALELRNCYSQSGE